MIDLAPFESIAEHKEYALAANVSYEDESIGFKIFSEEEKFGMIAFKLVGDAAYVLSAKAIDNKISVEMIANIFGAVVSFLDRLGVVSVVFPIQGEDDKNVAEKNGFDKISDTLYVFDFVAEEHEEKCDCH